MRPLFAVVFGILLAGQTAFALPDPIWQELPSMPEGRSGMVAFLAGESEPAYYGGSSWDEQGKHIHASGYVFRDFQWRTLASLESPIAYAAVALDQKWIYALGGTDGATIRRSMLIIDPKLEVRSINLSPQQAGLYAGAAFIDGSFFQLGGSRSLSPLDPTPIVNKFDGSNWSSVGKLPEGPLINPAVATWKGCALVFGGGIPSDDGLKNTNSVFSYDPIQGTWSKKANLPEPLRGAVAVSIPGTGLVIVGGYTDPPGFTSNVRLFDPEKDKFAPLPQLPTALMLPAVIANDQWIYIFGGEDAPKQRSNRVFRAELRRLIPNPAKK